MGTGSDYSVMVTDSTGKHWQLSWSSSDSTMANVDAVEMSYGPDHPTPSSLISGLSERSVICGTFRGASTVLPCTSTYTAIMSIDASGQVWIASAEGAPYQIQDNTKMDFYAMAIGQAITEGGYREYGYIYFLAQPRKQDSQTIINQMPTTGAPEGLTNVGLTALLTGVLGLMTIVVRRWN